VSLYDVREKSDLLKDYMSDEFIAMSMLRDKLGQATDIQVNVSDYNYIALYISKLAGIKRVMLDAEMDYAGISDLIEIIEEKLPHLKACIEAGYTEACTSHDHSGEDVVEEDEDYYDDADYIDPDGGW
jgi:hypothetical protein